MKQNILIPEHIVDIKGIPELDYIDFNKKEGLRIGTLTTHSALEDSAVVRKEYPIFAEMEDNLAVVQTRNCGTIGGNVCMDKGSTLNPNFIDYKLLRAYEAPFPKFAHVITHDPFGPYGVKECSEATTCTGAPALINAIYDATGVMIKNMPATPEKVWRALNEKRGAEKKK